MPRSKGFTHLVNPLIAIAILGIIASIAMPAMGKFIIQQRVSSQANEMMLSLAFARSEAIKRNARIAVIPVTNASTGWVMAGAWDLKQLTTAITLRSFAHLHRPLTYPSTAPI